MIRIFLSWLALLTADAAVSASPVLPRTPDAPQQVAVLPPASNPPPLVYNFPPPAGLVFPTVPGRGIAGTQPRHADPIGDAWELQEVADWRGIWIRRGSTRHFDAYWTHPSGERIRATVEIRSRGRAVTVHRRHDKGQSCRYDGVIGPDWIDVQGHYTCTWAKTPMPWRAQIVRMRDVTPRVLQGGWR